VEVHGIRGLVRAGAAASVALALVAAAAAPASASEVGDHLRAQRRLSKAIAKIERHHRAHARVLERRVTLAEREAEQHPGRATFRTMRLARHASYRADRRTRVRLRQLSRRLGGTEAWLSTWGVFRVCPVDGPRYIHDDFGEIVEFEGVPRHVHMGNDIEAPTWTPIRAPFDGYAWGSYTVLGGYNLRVRGDRGYVFNAHLVGYGHLGWVRAGTIVGYVGSGGDATAPHDHFEWHPWNGGAVDPHYLLMLACD
jgi:murein DD-endopeptidase MepM/ murein hydrolase activator NlpD